MSFTVTKGGPRPPFVVSTQISLATRPVAERSAGRRRHNGKSLKACFRVVLVQAGGRIPD
jgi:hypothetical protein